MDAATGRALKVRAVALGRAGAAQCRAVNDDRGRASDGHRRRGVSLFGIAAGSDELVPVGGADVDREYHQKHRQPLIVSHSANPYTLRSLSHRLERAVRQLSDAPCDEFTAPAIGLKCSVETGRTGTRVNPVLWPGAGVPPRRDAREASVANR
jgi:hypothetical protein